MEEGELIPDAKSLRIQVLGICRFSFPAELSSFRQNRDSLDARRAALYSAERMDLRFFWFENLLLPCIAAQRDKDFTLLVLLGDDIPEPYRSRMEQITAPVAQIKLVYRPSGNMRDTVRDIMKAEREPDADAIAEFWLDDDDGVGRNFATRARADFEHGRALFEIHARLAIDYQRGIVVTLTETGVEYLPLFARNWCAGQITYFKPSFGRCTMDFPHYRVWSAMPQISLNDQIMFARGEHMMNDSAIKTANGIPVRIPNGDVRGTLKRRFAVDQEAFEEAWANLRDARRVPRDG